jgi:hypothetical protein
VWNADSKDFAGGPGDALLSDLPALVTHAPTRLRCGGLFALLSKTQMGTNQNLLFSVYFLG